MSFAKLNVWIRDNHCKVLDMPGHLHVYNCMGDQIIHCLWFNHGHVEVQLQPGCYIVQAGVPVGNVYTHRTMVIVRCGDEGCVNLVHPKYVQPVENWIHPWAYITNGSCAAQIIVPLVMEAIKKKVDPKPALEVIMKTAEIDKKQMIAAINDEIKEIRESIKKEKISTEESKVSIKKEKISPKERKAVDAYLGSLDQVKRMLD